MDKKPINNLGLFITLTICTVTLWMYFTNKLVLFIHPRYFLFTAAFAAIGLILTLIALIITRNQPEPHTHDTEPQPKHTKKRIHATAALAFIALLAVFTPTSLSTQNINIERVNNFTFNQNETTGTEQNEYSIKNWSTVLTNNLPFDTTQKVTLTGFIVPIDDNNFYLTRYVLSCCAIDAQPVAVPIHAPQWTKTYKEGDWVKTQGKFQPVTSENYTHTLNPTKTNKIREPEEPYDY